MQEVQMTADVIIEMGINQIVFVKRKYEPFKESWALPGGKMEDDEKIENTAIREAKEETGLDIELTGIVGVYSKPTRDPRGRYISVVYTARVVGGNLHASDDAEQVSVLAIENLPKLAFDHNEILEDYKKNLNFLAFIREGKDEPLID